MEKKKSTMSPKCSLSCSSRAIKYFLFIVNFAILLAVMAIFMCSPVFNTDFIDKIQYFIVDSDVTFGSVILIVAGIMDIIAFLGCYGISKKSAPLMFTYSCAMAIFLMIQVSLIYLIYFLQDDLWDMVARKIHETMLEYENNKVLADLIDLLQYKLKCCGITESNDWNNILRDPNGAYLRNGDFPMPNSCAESTTFISNNIALFEVEPNEEGCLSRLDDLLNDNFVVIGYGFICILFFQLSLVILSTVLAHAFNERKAARKIEKNQNKTVVNKIFPKIDGKNKVFTVIEVIDLKSLESKKKSSIN